VRKEYCAQEQLRGKYFKWERGRLIKSRILRRANLNSQKPVSVLGNRGRRSRQQEIMQLIEHNAQGARVQVCLNKESEAAADKETVELCFDFRAGEGDMAPLFSGTSWGTMIWDASISMSKFLEKESTPMKGSVAELGACCGLPGLVCALRGASKVVLTDTPEYLDAMKMSVRLNTDALRKAALSLGEDRTCLNNQPGKDLQDFGNQVEHTTVERHSVMTESLYWGQENANAFIKRHGHMDLVLAAECVSTDVYGRQSWEALVDVICTLVEPTHGRVLLCSLRRPGDGLDEFLDILNPRFLNRQVHKLPREDTKDGYLDLYDLSCVCNP